MREAPALTILPQLIEKGAKIRAYDPEAMTNADQELKQYQQDIIYCAHEYEVMKEADALVLLTEWNQFRRLNLERVANLMKEPVFFDLRNIYEPEKVKEYGIEYIGVGVTSEQEGKKEINQSEEQIAAGGN